MFEKDGEALCAREGFADITLLVEMLSVAVVFHSCDNEMILAALDHLVVIQPNCRSRLMISLQLAAFSASLHDTY